MGKNVNSRTLGFAQETTAIRFLKNQGLQLLQRNFSCRAGEIDLIMLHPPDQLVFVEVRYRKTAKFGSALASVTRDKQNRIKRTAAAFLQSNVTYQSLACRFDIVAISGAEAENRELRWERNAFF